MAKPDLQKVYVKPDDGVVRRLDGKLGLAAAFDNLVNAANDTAAATAGVPVGALYHNAGAVRVRLT
jgi:hypothetical protein